MSMVSATEEQFWKSVDVLSELFKAVGGVTEIRNYSGKTIREAAEMMRRLGNAKVWMEPERPQHNL